MEKEYYERDERDAEEGWAIDVLDDDTHRGSSLCQAMSNGGEMDILVSLFLDILDRLLKQILTPSPRQSRVVRPMLGDKVAWLILAPFPLAHGYPSPRLNKPFGSSSSHRGRHSLHGESC